MFSITRSATLPSILFAAAALSGCADAPTRPTIAPADLSARFDAVKSWEATASTTWNARAIYRFDIEAGQRLGARAAALALSGALER